MTKGCAGTARSSHHTGGILVNLGERCGGGSGAGALDGRPGRPARAYGSPHAGRPRTASFPAGCRDRGGAVHRPLAPDRRGDCSAWIIGKSTVLSAPAALFSTTPQNRATPHPSKIKHLDENTAPKCASTVQVGSGDADPSAL